MVSRGQPLPAFDLHCPLLSLPLAFGTTLATIPGHRALSAAPAERAKNGACCCRAPEPARRPGVVGQADAQKRPQPQYRFRAARAAAGCARRQIRQPATRISRRRPGIACATFPNLLRLDPRSPISPTPRRSIDMLDLVDHRRYRGGASGRRHGQAGLDHVVGGIWTGAGCWSATIAPGIRPRGCSVKRRSAAWTA